MRYRRACCIFSLWFAVSGSLPAAEYPLWEIGAGVGVLSFPDYRGSDKQRSYVLPLPYLVYRGERLRVDRDKLRGLLLSGDNWEFNLSANAGVPVKSDDSDARTGMPDLDPTVELGPQLNVTLAGGRRDTYQLDLRLPVRQVWALDWPDLNGVGWLFTPTLNLDLRNSWPGPGWRTGLQLGLQYADSDYHDYYYGVAPVYARVDRPVYNTSGGYGSLQGTLSLSRRFDTFWVGTFVRATDLHGSSIEDSPLVRRKTNLMGGVAISWILGRSATRVEAYE